MRRLRKALQVGDHIENALKLVGITPERVEAFLGAPCRCRERKRKLNQVGNWAARWASKILPEDTTLAKQELYKIIGEEEVGTSPPQE